MRVKDAKFSYTFDDLMLVPQYSSVKSRKAPDVSVTLADLKLSIPIITAPMNTVTEHCMITVMHSLGGSSVLHRYMNSDQQLEQCIKAINIGDARNFFVALGAAGDFLDRANRLYDTLGLRHFCIDVANGHSQICLDAIEKLKLKIPNCVIMAGNVCTYDGSFRLVNLGADIVRVGVGPGSMCKTRIVTGHGVPQLTAIEECARVKATFEKTYIVADGGIRNSGDIVKALAAGADAVMVGGLVAGTSETPGPVIENKNVTYGFDGQYQARTTTISKVKKYAGMASEEGRKFNGWFTEEDASFIPEGAATEVPYKGPVKKVIDNLVGGLKVGMSYAGAMTIQELQENAEWVRVTENGRVEGTPHGK